MAGNGPYQNERAACAAARAAIPPEPGWSILSQAQMNELLHRALAEAGVETSEFENRTAWWLCGWEDYTIAIIVGWIARAFETGKAAGPDGAVTEWAVGYTHYPDVPGLAPRRVIQAYYSGEPDAREAVGEIRRLAPQDKPALMSREVGPWKEVSDA